MQFKLGLLLVAAAVTTGTAADLTVLSAGAVESAVRKLAKHYEREFSRDVEVRFATGPEITSQLSAGARADVLIAPVSVMAKAAKTGKVIGDTQADVARVGVGVAVRRGAAAPAIDTVNALKDALMRADSVVYNEASTGQYLDKLFERIGVLDQLKPKTTRYTSAAQVMEHVLRGKGNEIGFGPITEIRDYGPKGLSFVGPLPADVQHFTTYVAAVMTEARAPDAGRDFVRYLTSAAARRTFATTGVDTSLR